MTGKKRDYRAEYARRIDKGTQRGLTRSQARGHPSAGQSLVSQPSQRPTYSPRLEAGFKALQKGRSLTSAAKEIHVSPERLRRYLRESGIAERQRGRWVSLPDPRTRRMLLYSLGEARTVDVHPTEATKIGEYMHAVGEFLISNDPAHLSPFLDRGVTDTKRRFHRFETSENRLYRLTLTGTETFEAVYRIIT